MKAPDGTEFLLVSLEDLVTLGSVGGLGSPLILLLSEQRGEEVVGMVWFSSQALPWIACRVQRGRGADIAGGLDVMLRRVAKRPLKYRVQTAIRQTVHPIRKDDLAQPQEGEIQ